MKATFQKLRSGEWGLRVQGLARGGEVVEVTTKARKTETKTVGRVVWSGEGITLATIAGQSRPSREGSTYERGVGWTCDECGERAEKGTRCWETGAQH